MGHEELLVAQKWAAFFYGHKNGHTRSCVLFPLAEYELRLCLKSWG
jgi:hypothetical protein